MSIETQTVKLGRGLADVPVLVKGDGPPLVYLHGLLGQAWSPLLEGLSAQRRVYAPALAGADEPDDLKAFDNVHDLTIYLDDLVRALGLKRFELVGHSFGGMVAAEYAAMFPERVTKLVLIDSLGLWRDDAPVVDFTYQTPPNQAALILGEADSEAVQQLLALPEEPRAKNRETVRRITSMASILHFIWPIPDRGLAKRLYRVQAPTQLIWGEQDQIVPKIYAEDFAKAIGKSQVHIIAGASHTPHFQKPDAVLDKVQSFLAEQS
ncbi:MAG: alpha/beta fold hydrolase [Janthinobacterium lividum]